MLTDTTRSPYAKVHALDGMKVKWTGGLLKERFDTCANSTVPAMQREILTEPFLETEISINGWSLPSILLTRQIISC